MKTRTLRSRRALAGVWAGVAFTVLLNGAHAMEPNRPSFEQLDSDGNGAISAAELSARLSGRRMSPEILLQRFDTDGNGSIEQAEFDAARDGGSRRSRHGFVRVDADQDGQLSKDEFLASAPPRRRDPGTVFDTLDANGDGYLSAAEAAEIRQHRGQKYRQN